MRKGEAHESRAHTPVSQTARPRRHCAVPDIQAGEIMVKVAACGMCRSDVLLVDGFFQNYGDIPPPVIPGHEINWHDEKIGSVVPKAAGLEEGDHVVVAPGWGDGVCPPLPRSATRASAPTYAGLASVPMAGRGVYCRSGALRDQGGAAPGNPRRCVPLHRCRAEALSGPQEEFAMPAGSVRIG